MLVVVFGYLQSVVSDPAEMFLFSLSALAFSTNLLIGLKWHQVNLISMNFIAHPMIKLINDKELTSPIE